MHPFFGLMLPLAGQDHSVSYNIKVAKFWGLGTKMIYGQREIMVRVKRTTRLRLLHSHGFKKKVHCKNREMDGSCVIVNNPVDPFNHLHLLLLRPSGSTTTLPHFLLCSQQTRVIIPPAIRGFCHLNINICHHWLMLWFSLGGQSCTCSD